MAGGKKRKKGKSSTRVNDATRTTSGASASTGDAGASASTGTAGASAPTGSSTTEVLSDLALATPDYSQVAAETAGRLIRSLKDIYTVKRGKDIIRNSCGPFEQQCKENAIFLNTPVNGVTLLYTATQLLLENAQKLPRTQNKNSIIRYLELLLNLISHLVNSCDAHVTLIIGGVSIPDILEDVRLAINNTSQNQNSTRGINQKLTAITETVNQIFSACTIDDSNDFTTPDGVLLHPETPEETSFKLKYINTLSFSDRIMFNTVETLKGNQSFTVRLAINLQDIKRNDHNDHIKNQLEANGGIYDNIYQVWTFEYVVNSDDMVEESGSNFIQFIQLIELIIQENQVQADPASDTKEEDNDSEFNALMMSMRLG